MITLKSQAAVPGGPSTTSDDAEIEHEGREAELLGLLRQAYSLVGMDAADLPDDSPARQLLDQIESVAGIQNLPAFKAAIGQPGAPETPDRGLAEELSPDVLLATLDDAQGVIDQLVCQVDQMSGMFDDEDGAIQSARDDAEAMSQRLAYLRQLAQAGVIEHAPAQAVPVSPGPGM